MERTCSSSCGRKALCVWACVGFPNALRVTAGIFCCTSHGGRRCGSVLIIVRVMGYRVTGYKWNSSKFDIYLRSLRLFHPTIEGWNLHKIFLTPRPLQLLDSPHSKVRLVHGGQWPLQRPSTRFLLPPNSSPGEARRTHFDAS